MERRVLDVWSTLMEPATDGRPLNTLRTEASAIERRALNAGRNETRRIMERRTVNVWTELKKSYKYEGS
ncbi:predicted protein [Sclerotinia sclerotiorum 1980 UF-70]|uniref:Uncharacterized protein n=1 Tax=Sclerotinia sclerotiorum (strain ATCC 18683 / 1980 / Ss-1) TaxID=665079 RepID=A7E6U9_SCLS1|nr:predicted protein [Sclerotinia sclerotiorum 1980 UF-70]EDN91621.1 predicted protein [Sclerotinia sclerotiorum 1980 UF-70]